MNANKGLKPYSQAIWAAANEFGIDATYFASLVKFESGGNPNAVSKAGAVGLGQVIPGKNFQGHVVTAQDLKDPTFNLRVAAWYFEQGLEKYGNYQDAYTKYYNPGASKATTGVPFGDVPKGYVVAGGYSPTQKANAAADAAVAQAAQPALQLAAARRLLDPLYMAYANRRASDREVKSWLGAAGGSAGMIETGDVLKALANPKTNPAIYKSPIWLTHAGDYEAAYKDIFGQTAQAPRAALLYGLVHNLSQSAFQQGLRDGTIPGQAPYTQSEKFKGDMSDAQSVYESIYGRPDGQGTAFLKSAVLGGWTGNQIAQYLRSRPEYTSSGEYKTRAISLASQMGLVPQGIGQTALAGVNAPQPAVQQPAPPPPAPPAGPPPSPVPPASTVPARPVKPPLPPGE